MKVGKNKFERRSHLFFPSLESVMNLTLPFCCFLLTSIIYLASAQHVIRLKIAMEHGTLDDINERDVANIVWHMNNWFKNYDVHMQWMNLTFLPDNDDHVRMSQVFDHWKKKQLPDHSYHNRRLGEFIQIWTHKQERVPQMTIGNSFCNPNRRPFGVVYTRKTVLNLVQNRDYIVQRRSIQSILTSLGLMKHQQDRCECSRGRSCLLDSSSDWSDTHELGCLPDLIRDRLKDVNCTKVRQPQVSHSSIPICRNGIKEYGEQCDCFKSNSTCKESCDMDYCKWKDDPCLLTTTTTEFVTATDGEEDETEPEAITTVTNAPTTNVTAAPASKDRDGSTTLAVVLSIVVIVLLLLGSGFLYFLSKGNFFKSTSCSGRHLQSWFKILMLLSLISGVEGSWEEFAKDVFLCLIPIVCTPLLAAICYCKWCKRGHRKSRKSGQTSRQENSGMTESERHAALQV